MTMDRRNLLIWGLGAAGLGLVRYWMYRNQYQTVRHTAAAATASMLGDLMGAAIPQLQHPAMLLAAHQAQKAARQFYRRVPHVVLHRRPARPPKAPKPVKIRDAEFEIIDNDRAEKKS